MPQVSVTIAGRVYRMACDEGEEAHLHELATIVDGRIALLRGQFGEIGDQRITIMASITLADDLSDAEKRIGALEAEIASLTRDRSALEGRIDTLGAQLSARLNEAASRIDQIARDLGGDGLPWSS